MITIRQSLQTEHEDIHEALVAATRSTTHAQPEEAILYPAAMLVGDAIRARMAKQ